MKAIFTKYLPQTATKPARVRASDSDGNAATVTYHGDFPSDRDSDAPLNLDPYQWAAYALCRKMGWTGKLAQGGHSKGNVFVFVNPDEFLEVK